MRRRTDTFRHTMEVLIGQAALDLKAQGYAALSLSGAPLATVDDAPESGAPEATPASEAAERILELVGRQLEPLYGFRSLLRFKSTFQPAYRPLSLAYPDPASLPAIAAAVTRAYVPDASWATLWRVLAVMRSSRD